MKARVKILAFSLVVILGISCQRAKRVDRCKPLWQARDDLRVSGFECASLRKTTSGIPPNGPVKELVAKRPPAKGTANVTSRGTFEYVLPLETAVGRAGLSPQLRLTYDSGRGNGALGVGFQVGGFGEIRRCKGSAQLYEGSHNEVRLTNSDDVCLDGVVLVRSSELCPDSEGVSYRTRLNGSSRICRYGSLSDLGTYFVEETKGGRLNYYGADPFRSPMTSAGLIFPSTGTLSRIAWPLTRIEDRFSNFMTIEYQYSDGLTEEADDHIYGNVPEADVGIYGGLEVSGGGLGLTLATSPIFAVSKIRYTGNREHGLSPQRTVTFDYSSRKDLVSGFYYGEFAAIGYRLSQIRSLIGHGDNEVQAWEYRLSYVGDDSPTQPSRLASVRRCAETSGEMCRSPIRFEWSQGSSPVTAFHPPSVRKLPVPSYFGFAGLVNMDYSGVQSYSLRTLLLIASNPPCEKDFACDSALCEGKPGLFEPLLESLTFGAHDDDGRCRGQSAIVHYGSETPPRPAQVGKTIIRGGTADLDNDSRADLYGLVPPSTWSGLPNGDRIFDKATGDYQPLKLQTWRNGGSSFSAAELFPGARTQPPLHLAVADFNGDGRVDIADANGVAFGGEQRVGEGTQPASVGSPLGKDDVVFDIDGDGAAEIVAGSKLRELRLVDGVAEWTETDVAAHLSFLSDKAKPREFHDLNADGLTDIVEIAGSPGAIQIFLNRGDSTFAGPILVPEAETGIARLRGFADTNGNGIDEFIWTVGLSAPSSHSVVRGLEVVGLQTVVFELDQPLPASAAGLHYGDLSILTFDSNADGRDDLLVGSSIRRTEGPTWNHLESQSQGRNQLVKIFDGFAAPTSLSSIQVTYSGPADRSAYSSRLQSSKSCPKRHICGDPPAKLLVKNLRLESRIYKYGYGDARYSRASGEFLGYMKRSVEEPARNSRSEYAFDLEHWSNEVADFTRSSLPARELHYVYPLSTTRVEREFDIARLGSSYTPFARATKTNVLDHVVGATVSGSTQSRIDSYGNLTFASRSLRTLEGAFGESFNTLEPPMKERLEREQKIASEAGEDRELHISYGEDPDSLLLGLSKRRVLFLRNKLTSADYPALGGVQRFEQTMEYDGAHSSLTKVVDLRDGNVSGLVEFSHDDFGNVVEVARAAPGGARRSTVVRYSVDEGDEAEVEEFAFPLALVDASGSTSRFSFGRASGRVVGVVDGSGLVSTFDRDRFGTLLGIKMPDGARSSSTFGITLGVDGIVQWTVEKTLSSGEQTSQSHGRDGGLTRQTKVLGDSRVVQLYRYDSFGRVSAFSAPFVQAVPQEELVWFETEYDNLHRAVKKIGANGITRLVYSGLAVRETRPGRRRFWNYFSAQGDLLVRRGPLGAQSAFWYGGHGNLARVAQWTGKVLEPVLEATWSSQSNQLLSMSRSHTAPRTYQYNGFGELSGNQSAGEPPMKIERDALGRIVRWSAGEEWASWGYAIDANDFRGGGRLVSANTKSTKRSYSYEVGTGRLKSEVFAIGDDRGKRNYRYDAHGRISSVEEAGLGVPPRRFQVDYRSDGLPKKTTIGHAGVEAGWDVLSYGPRLRPTERVTSSGHTERRGFDARSGDFESIDVRDALANQIEGFQIERNPSGSVTRLTGLRSLATKNDQLDRLRVASSLLGVSYDLLGNITKKSDVGGYGYDASRARLVSIGDRKVVYHEGGEIAGFENWRAEYNAVGKLEKLVEGGESPRESRFHYDAFGRLASHVHRTGNTRTEHLYNGNTKVTREFKNNSKTRESSSITAPFEDGIGAELYASSGGTDDWPSGRARYIFSDQVASPVVVVESGNGEVERRQYGPFGEMGAFSETSLASASVSYGGHRPVQHWPQFVDMGGRTYWRDVGRFLQPDPMLGDLSDLQRPNAYSYVLNDPLTLSDPTGLELRLVTSSAMRMIALQSSLLVTKSRSPAVRTVLLAVALIRHMRLPRRLPLARALQLPAGRPLPFCKTCFLGSSRLRPRRSCWSSFTEGLAVTTAVALAVYRGSTS